MERNAGGTRRPPRSCGGGWRDGLPEPARGFCRLRTAMGNGGGTGTGPGSPGTGRGTGTGRAGRLSASSPPRLHPSAAGPRQPPPPRAAPGRAPPGLGEVWPCGKDAAFCSPPLFPLSLRLSEKAASAQSPELLPAPCMCFSLCASVCERVCASVCACVCVRVAFLVLLQGTMLKSHR